MAVEEHIEFKGFLSFLILHELKHAHLYGDQLAKQIGSRKGEKLTPGTIYPALKALRHQKLLQYHKEGRKKVYALTRTGERELRRLYRLFGRYFRGLESKIPRKRKKKPKRRTPQK